MNGMSSRRKKGESISKGWDLFSLFLSLSFSAFRLYKKLRSNKITKSEYDRQMYGDKDDDLAAESD